MKTPWITLFARSYEIALGAPQVIAARVQLLNQPVWPLATWLEAQRMVWEKMLAASEIWWGFWRAAPVARPRTRLGLPHHHVATANRALGPLARKVNANVRRLRKR